MELRLETGNSIKTKNGNILLWHQVKFNLKLIIIKELTSNDIIAGNDREKLMIE